MKSTGGFDRYFFRAFNTMKNKAPSSDKMLPKTRTKKPQCRSTQKSWKTFVPDDFFDIRLKRGINYLRENFPFSSALKAKSSSRTWEGFDLRQ